MCWCSIHLEVDMVMDLYMMEEMDQILMVKLVGDWFCRQTFAGGTLLLDDASGRWVTPMISGWCQKLQNKSGMLVAVDSAPFDIRVSDQEFERKIGMLKWESKSELWPLPSSMRRMSI